MEQVQSKHQAIKTMDAALSHNKIKNFVQKLENDILEEAKQLDTLKRKRQTSIKAEEPQVERHATLTVDDKQVQLPILKGKSDP